jgi:hypothetical protein
LQKQFSQADKMYVILFILDHAVFHCDGIFSKCPSMFCIWLKPGFEKRNETEKSEKTQKRNETNQREKNQGARNETKQKKTGFEKRNDTKRKKIRN